MSDLTLREGSDGSLVALDGDAEVGTITLAPPLDGSTEVSWDLGTTAFRTRGEILRLVVAHAFDRLGLTRVVAYVDADDLTDRRSASMAGLRLDGRIRRHSAPDRVLLVRLVDDPEPSSRDGFISMLNANLPKKRAIAQGLLYDDQDRILLCELTYKHEWDLPGGVVDPDESPADAIVRELHEELGVDVAVRGLRTVNWLPSWRAWDDAVVFVFDLEPLAADVAMVFQPTEIADIHWCGREAVAEHATLATQELLASLRQDPHAPYREAGTPADRNVAD